MQLVSLEDFDVIHDFSHGHILARKFQNLPILNMLWDPVIRKYPKAPYNVVCLSRWQAKRFMDLYDQDSRILPPMVNSDRFKPGNGRNRRFLFLGKISPEKGVHRAIEYARNMKVGLDVVGGLIPSEQNSPYVKEIRGMCDSELMKFHFNVTEDEKIRFLQEAGAILYPVEQEEAHWLVGCEAWMCGTPSIVYNKGAMGEIVAPEVGFCVFSYDDFPVFMMHRWNEWDRLGTRIFAVENYSIHSVLPKYLKLYEKVSKGERW